MEQRQLAWLITMRSQVRVLVPQPRKKDCRKVVLFSWFVGQDENRTAKPRFDNKELTQVLAPSKRRRYMREGAIVLVPQPRKKPHRKVRFFLGFGQAPVLGPVSASWRKSQVRRSEDTRRSLLRARRSGEGRRPLSWSRNR